MKKLQEVQYQITEMIKKDYPRPIFNYAGNKLEFQFDSISYHGNLEIGIFINEGVYMEAGNIECIGDTFMEDFKKVYQREQLELSLLRF